MRCAFLPRLVLTAVCLSTVGAYAEPALAPARFLVPTEAVLGSQALDAQAQEVLRGRLASALVERGVEAGAARERVAALSDTQALQLERLLDIAPAGGSELIGSAVFVSVALLFSDVLGYTKVYPFVLRPGTPQQSQ